MTTPRSETYRQKCVVEMLTSGTRTSLRRATLWAGYSRGRQESWAGLLADKGVLLAFREAMEAGRPLPVGHEDQIIAAIAELEWRAVDVSELE
jgi:hypothetical protein